MISARMPTRTMTTGLTLPLLAPANPLATNEPAASARSTNPVCRASKPSTNCSQSGSDRMMPNSPSATTSAAMLPLRNEEMRKRENSSRDDSPRRVLVTPRTMNATSASAATAKATGTGEIGRGHSNEPIVKVSLTAHQP